jgi:hypothetical protein
MSLMTSPAVGRQGAQVPRLRSVPGGVSSAGDEAVDLAARAGLSLYPWQQLVLRDALAERADGRWAAFEVGLVVPRQNGKGTVLEALELAALFLPEPGGPAPLILHSAHEFKTSAEHFRRMRDLVERTPLLQKQVRIIRTAAGAESIELHTGARLRFVTRTGGSGRGFSADLVVIDEAYNLTAEAMAAVLPTLSTRPNPQIWYTSSAGMASSEQLSRVRARGQAGGDSSLAYFEWSAADGASLDDRDAWAEANPSLGLRIPESFVAQERAALPDEQFGRERLGLWADRGDSSAFPPEVWASLADPAAERGAAPAFGVATAPDRSWAAVAVAWKRPDGLSQVMLADYRPSTTWLAARVAELRSSWGGVIVADTASRELIDGAVEPSEADQAIAHNALSDAVLAGTVRHGNEPALNTAVRGAKWKPLGNTQALARRGSVDISPLAAAALALSAVDDTEGPNLW